MVAQWTNERSIGLAANLKTNSRGGAFTENEKMTTKSSLSTSTAIPQRQDWAIKETVEAPLQLGRYDIAFYDLETDGLLEEVTLIHSLVIEFGDGDIWDCADQPGYIPIADGLRELAKCKIRVGHNSQDYDERVLKKLPQYSWLVMREDSDIIDTLIVSRLVFPEIRNDGPNSHKLLPHMKNSHSLEAWGKRLGHYKGDYKGPWDKWSPEMQAYCRRDVSVLRRLFNYLMGPKRITWQVQNGFNWKTKQPKYKTFSKEFPAPDPRAVRLEHEFAAIIRRQESRGVTFDHEAAQVLLAILQKREAELEARLIETFGEWWQYQIKSKKRDAVDSADPDDIIDTEDEETEGEAQEFNVWDYTRTVPKSRRVRMKDQPQIAYKRFRKDNGAPLPDKWDYPLIDYEKGAVYTPIERVQFNPGSRQHVERALKQKYGWKPTKFTKTGQAIINDDILKGLEFPEAKLLAEYLMIQKRLGQLATGKNAWMQLAVLEEDGEWRIHGRVNTNGAVTGRCTHSKPNLAQVPKANERTEYGHECRALFKARKRYKLLGFDGQGLELRMLGHYVSPWDGGTYGRIVANEDPHSWTRDTIGFELMTMGGTGDHESLLKLGRDRAKTVIYAFIYGAGDLKIGVIILGKVSDAEKLAIGREVRTRLLDRFEALGKLQDAIADRTDNEGYLTGLDGRILRLRKKNAALNTLLQSAGAVVMKKALVILDKSIQAAGLVPGKDYEFVLNVHDEAQIEVLPEHIELISELALKAVEEAGRQLKLKTPLASSVDVGANWAETH